jgi:glycosyltransferase involved in cell wall biosynthesis
VKSRAYFFSVVIPLYNKEGTINRAVESVLCQKFKDFELIVIDDGSTDNGLEVLDSITDNRLVVISQRNKGVSTARNVGVNKACGKLVCFLDADDVWMPDHLTTLYSLYKDNSTASLFSCRHSVVDESGSAFLRKPYAKTADFGGVLTDFFEVYKFLEVVNSSTAAASKISLTEIGGFPESSNRGEDIWTWLRLADLADVCYSDKVTVIVHRDAENRSFEVSGFEIPIHIRKLKDGLDEISSRNYKKVKSFICLNAVKLALGALARNQRSDALNIAKFLYPSCLSGGSFIVLISIFPANFFLAIKRWRNK